MKYKPLPVGVDNLEKLITRGYYFVDKTNLIRDLLDMKAEEALKQIEEKVYQRVRG